MSVFVLFFVITSIQIFITCDLSFYAFFSPTIMFCFRSGNVPKCFEVEKASYLFMEVGEITIVVVLKLD